MNAEANKVFIQQYLETICKDKSAITLDTYMVDEELKRHILMFEASFPGYWLWAEEMIAEGDQIVVRTVMQGIHKGQLFNISPTGKLVTVYGVVTYRVVDGKIVDHWMLLDMLGLFRQLGGAAHLLRS
jgi:predicted ester cyclase